MNNRRHILPPQTTPLERAVDQSVPAWGWMADSVTPTFVARDPAFTPWLALQWQVAQFAVYFDTAQALLAAALPWLRQRGNAASLRTALTWATWTNVLLDEDGAWLHLDLGRIVGNDQLLPVAHLARASIPAHVRFYRVYHGYDARPVRTDGGPSAAGPSQGANAPLGGAAQPAQRASVGGHDGLDAGLLDDDSGVWVDVSPWGDPVKVSQGVRRGGVVAAPPLLGREQAGHVLWHTSVATYTDRLLLDAWSLDSELLADSSGGHTVLHIGISNAPPRLPPLWPLPAPVRSAQCAWIAPPPLSATGVTHVSQTDLPHDDQRTWNDGCWDDAPWRLEFPSRITYIKD